MADFNVDVNLPSAINVDITSPTQALATNISIPGPQGPVGATGPGGGATGPTGPTGPSGVVNTGELDLRYYSITNPSGFITGVDLTNYITGIDNILYTTGDQAISGVKTFKSRPSVNGTGVLLSGQNSFIITLYNTSDAQGAGHNYFGNIAAAFSSTAGGVNRRFPILESCIVRKAAWTQYNQTIGNPSQNSTGYFINTTTNTTGIISTTINTQSTNIPTHYITEFSPPITISTGDYIVCSLFGPTFATTYPATVRNTVNLYCYN